MPRILLLMLATCVVLILGCASAKRIPQKTSIKLEDVPADVMKVARQKMPDVKFDRAWKNDEGVYEIGGKTKTGKTCEIDVKPDLTVVEIENYP